MASPETSTTPRPRKERAENAAMRRRQIIEATGRSIVKHGLGGTTLATVAGEAGLSQGVAVFYFQNKQTLLAEVLRNHYEAYQANWLRERAAAGTDPVARLAALVRSDFDPAVCNADSLVVWHAFWGEATARPMFAAIAEAFDRERADAMRGACAALLEAEGRPTEGAGEIGTTIDALTDGLWLRIYLSSGGLQKKEALRLTARFVAASFPDHAEALLAAIRGEAPPPEG